MDLGAVLREARERRGLSVEELSRSTKINPSTLRALESSHFDRIAHGIFVRGFLRAYAREVGLDAEQIVRRYRDEFEPDPEPATAGPPQADPAPRLQEAAGDQSSTPRTLLMLAALIAAATGSYLMVRPSDATDPVTESAAPEPAANAPAVSPVATTGPATPQPAPQPAAPIAQDVRIAIRTVDECWIAATADGVRVAFEVVPGQSQRTFEAREALVLRIGAPSAMTYMINGSPGRPLGRPGQPVTVRLTPQNYREFLAP